MNLLLTGCFNYSAEQLHELQLLGYNIYYIQQESEDIPVNPQIYNAIVCNGLFQFHDIRKFTNIEFIQLTSAGLDRVPLEYIKQSNIQIFNARGVYSIPMAEWAVTKVLDIYKHSEFFYENQKLKQWEKNRYQKEIFGKKIAIIGAGSVGIEVAKRFKGLGASTVGFDLIPLENSNFDIINPIFTLFDSVDKFDVIVVTLPLTKETKGMFDYDFFKRLKKEAIILNISRGGVFIEEDLIHALKKRDDIIAALDVFDMEPLSTDSELWDLPNAVLSPHNSFVSDNNNKRMFDVIYTNLRNFAKI